MREVHPGQEPMDFEEAVYEVARSIPAGHVLGYLDVAEILEGGGARQVGKAMSRGCPDGVPWWRVIRSDGTIAASLSERARAHWDDENTPMRGGRVDMRSARYFPDAESSARLAFIAERWRRQNVAGK